MEAFIELYKDVYKDLYRVAYYYMGNAAEAEDAVSDAVLKAYENFASLREPTAFRGWMMRILVNTCKKRMRGWFRKDAEITEIDPAMLSHAPDYSNGPALKAAFQVLTEEERLIVALSVLGGYKGEEIAGLIQKNHSTVRSKYRRALEKLKSALQE